MTARKLWHKGKPVMHLPRLWYKHSNPTCYISCHPIATVIIPATAAKPLYRHQGGPLRWWPGKEKHSLENVYLFIHAFQILGLPGSSNPQNFTSSCAQPVAVASWHWVQQSIKMYCSPGLPSAVHHPAPGAIQLHSGGGVCAIPPCTAACS
jgi:hypothetical protein